MEEHGPQGHWCAAGPALGSSEHRIPVHSVGHVGVKRIVKIDEHDSAAMVVMDISVGLHAHQRGAHMSRLIECIDRPGPQPTVLDYAQGIFERLRDAVPGAASWSVDARATIVLPHDGGFKPIEEICRIEAAERTEVTWGAAFKVCLACPQAQSAIAFDREDLDNVGEHPSHNQVCDLEITVTGDLTTVAGRSLTELLAVGGARPAGRCGNCISDVAKPTRSPPSTTTRCSLRMRSG